MALRGAEEGATSKPPFPPSRAFTESHSPEVALALPKGTKSQGYFFGGAGTPVTTTPPPLG